MTTAVVLGGGGVAGVAWHTGVLAGLAESGVDVSDAGTIVGTSAGATVAAQLGAGLPLDELVRRQLDPSTLSSELLPGTSVADLVPLLGRIWNEAADAADRRRRIGAMALGTTTVDEAARRRVIAARLAGVHWTGNRVAVTAVDAVTGDRRVFRAGDGVDLVDAVTASSAVPGVWPPVTIGGARYVDGGVWSLTNTDLAAGCDRVLVLAPIVDPALETELAGLGDTPTVVVRPDEDSLVAFGPDVLDPAARAPSVRAGLAQGRAEAGRVGRLFAD